MPVPSQRVAEGGRGAEQSHKIDDRHNPSVSSVLMQMNGAAHTGRFVDKQMLKRKQTSVSL